MSSTARFALPLLAAGQAQKELFHNEALSRIDALLHPCVEAVGVEAPPSAPLPGQMWIVGSAPTDAWESAAGQLAVWTEGGWRFIVAREGMTVRIRGEHLLSERLEDSWETGRLAAAGLFVSGEQVVGPRQPAIDDPSGGVTIDLVARGAISGILNTLREHGLIGA